MIIIYVDDILVVLKETSTDIDYLTKKYALKEGSMGPPNQHLVSNIDKGSN